MKYLIITFTTIMFVTTICVFLLTEDRMVEQERSIGHLETQVFRVPLYDLFYDKIVFNDAINTSKEIKEQENVRSLIVPHHLVGADIISGTLKRASGKKYNNIVIIGANHFMPEIDSIQTTTGMWETQLGDVHVNNNLAEKLIEDFRINSVREMFLQEHSIGAVLPFVDYYFDDFRLLPIAINTYATEQDARKLSEWLISNLDEDDLVVYSIDFSHYLTVEKAREMDELTKKLIDARAVDLILSLNDDNVDSPVSLAISLLNAEKQGLRTNIIYNKNSFDYMSNKPIETTSYFGIFFTK